MRVFFNTLYINQQVVYGNKGLNLAPLFVFRGASEALSCGSHKIGYAVGGRVHCNFTKKSLCSCRQTKLIVWCREVFILSVVPEDRGQYSYVLALAQYAMC